MSHGYMLEHLMAYILYIQEPFGNLKFILFIINLQNRNRCGSYE